MYKMEEQTADPPYDESRSMEGVEEMGIDDNPEYEGNEKVHRLDNTQDQKELLHKLGLTSFFPEKITLQNVLENASGKLETLADVPWYFLTKMLMVNCMARDGNISDKIKSDLNTHSTVTQDDESADDYDRLFSELREDISTSNSGFCVPHPSDIIIVVFRCSSNFLRQILAEKMFMCKLSIPLVLPPFMDKKSKFLLWSLRSIILEFKKSNDVLCKSSAVKIPTPVVSCLRLGDISRSKSKFLNEVLNSQGHPTFCHRDCKNGMNNRLLSDGLIEVAWLLPSKKSRVLPDVDKAVAVLNLRGDGMSQETSTRFMCQVSNVIITFIDICALEDKNVIANLKSLSSYDAELFIFVTKQSNVNPIVKSMDAIKNCVEAVKCDNFKKENIILSFAGSGEKNIEELKTNVVNKVSECLIKKRVIQEFEKFGDIAKSLSVIVDEDTIECRQAQQKALELVEKVHGYGQNNLKTTMLPLQCELWQKWAELDLEEHRRNKKDVDDAMPSYMNKINHQKEWQRKEQVTLMRKGHPIFETFVSYLLKSESEARLYYLKWLKLYLDDMSRETLPHLQKECCDKWNAIREYEVVENIKQNPSKLQTQLNDMEKKLADSSFGLEHLIREIAQAYEAAASLKEKEKQAYKRVIDLPRIIAELMLLGYPLELMDGDVAHVPLLWINAVLEQLRKEIGEEKIFVLSVLGIQSSGKSTMLNTMFGLQFAVSAGRCTRGVYAQLVPVCKEYSSGKYSYILVVDTEGLKSANLGKDKVQHDNEIATLVIGLGDVTLVNVMGESVSEIEDVLQITIHALLKMKLVNKNLALQPSCFFIHQNVPAPDAAQQLRSGQQKLIETLDRVTEVAGEQEDAPQYTKFSQLIDFDINTNISYVSCLWTGNPPMAPISPGYSENIDKVKQTLLTDIMSKRSLQLNIYKFGTKLKDLWNGIMDQNFVFSFKNNLEMEAYNSLDGKLSDILWSLKMAGRKWQSDKETKIMNNEHGTKELGNNLTKELQDHLNETYKEAQVNLTDLFATHEERSIVEQWRYRSFQKLRNCYEDNIRDRTKAIKWKLETRQSQIDLRNNITKSQPKLMKMAKKLADTLRENDKKLDDDQLRVKFDKMCETWIKDLRQNPEVDVNIEEIVNNVLLEEFPQDGPLVNKALKVLPNLNLESIVTSFKNVMDKHVSTKGFFGLFKDKVKKTCELREHLFEDIKGIVQSTSPGELKATDCQHIIKKATDMIKKIKENGLVISHPEDFGICIIAYACQYASCEYSNCGKIGSVADGDYKFGEFGMHPYFEQELLNMFSYKLMSVISETKYRGLNRFMIDVKSDEHVSNFKNMERVDNQIYADNTVRELYDSVRKYVDNRAIQDFKKEYVEQIINMVVKKIENETHIKFTKNLKIQLAVHICYFTLPTFREKHKRYMDNNNPRKVFERDYYEINFQKFKNLYDQIADEKALSLLLCKRLSQSVEQAVDKDLATELANAVRNNVPEIRNKPAFLKAVLVQLLKEDTFDDFRQYLVETEACFEKWISFYIDNYLFSGNSKYLDISSEMITSLLAMTCNIISSSRESLRAKMRLDEWVTEFQKRVSEKLPIPLQDLLGLIDGYTILNLDSFTENLENNLKKSKETLLSVFHHRYLREHKICPDKDKDSVYTIMFKECKGCTEKCPFCSSPCTLNAEDHIEDGIKHMAKEHYPQACGGYMYETSKKLHVNNCSADVASEDQTFKNTKTNDQIHFYKNYKDIYPDWEIDPDPSVKASPYWKWFLVKYESELAETYRAKRPDIPSSWNDITIDMARESAMKFTSSS